MRYAVGKRNLYHTGLIQHILHDDILAQFLKRSGEEILPLKMRHGLYL